MDKAIEWLLFHLNSILFRLKTTAKSTATSFHKLNKSKSKYVVLRCWRGRLGLGYYDAIAKEHWTRVKALSRHLAGGGDEYSNLRPVADLLSSLQEEAAKWLDRPAEWNLVPTNEDEREAALDSIRQAVFGKLHDLVTVRLRDDQVSQWRRAYDFSGKGLASLRADLIDDIHQEAAPHMSAAITQDARDFLDKLYIIIQETTTESGGDIKSLAA